MKTLTIKVPDALFAEITAAAQTRQVSRSEIIRERLTRHLVPEQGTKQSLWSRMQDLVIDDDSLPTDLSSNKAHLDGYGQQRSD